MFNQLLLDSTTLFYLITVSLPNRGRKDYEKKEPYPHDHAVHKRGVKLTCFVNPVMPEDGDKQQSINACYEMSRHPHGIAIIISNKHFPSSSKLITIEAADNDEKNLTETLRFLGYTVEIYRDCEAQKMVEIFDSIKDSALQIHDSFVCCILSHGTKGKMIFASDGVLVNLDHLTLNLMNCENLCGKPKLVFIQACRGRDQDEGAMATTLGDSRKVKIPLRADIFFSFATAPGFCAYAFEDGSSSNYIKELCKTFCKYAKHTDLTAMHTTINNSTAQYQVYAQEMKDDMTDGAEMYKQYKQMPEVQHTLCKNVYFF